MHPGGGTGVPAPATAPDIRGLGVDITRHDIGLKAIDFATCRVAGAVFRAAVGSKRHFALTDAKDALVAEGRAMCVAAKYCQPGFDCG